MQNNETLPIRIGEINITPKLISELENFKDFHSPRETKNTISELSCKLASWQHKFPDDLEAKIGELPEDTFFLLKDLLSFFDSLEEAFKEEDN